MALISAAVAAFSSLGFACCACCPNKNKIFAVFSGFLAIGGVLGLAGAANYRSTIEKACDGDKDWCAEADASICESGCTLSMVGGILAMLAGGAAVATAVAFGGDGASTAPAEHRVPLAPAVQMTTTGPSMQVAQPVGGKAFLNA